MPNITTNHAITYTNWASELKLQAHAITSELYDTKSYYQLIVNNKMGETFKSTVEKRLSKSKENISE